MEKGNGLSEKETLMEKILLYCLKFPIGWSYYAGSCCCFSPVSEEKMKRLVKSTQRSIIREFKKTGILPFEGPLKPSDKNYKITGKMFPGGLPLRKDLLKYSPRCRKRGIPDKQSAKVVLEAIRWQMWA
jgi:hypothetical protein